MARKKDLQASITRLEEQLEESRALVQKQSEAEKTRIINEKTSMIDQGYLPTADLKRLVRDVRVQPDRWGRKADHFIEIFFDSNESNDPIGALVVSALEW